MRIVVVGVGQVGRAVAEGLSGEHEIIVVDHDPDKLENIRHHADVMTLEGDGADLEALEGADVADADMVIASTDDDRTNILVCATADALNDEVFTIARVADTGFLRSWRYSKRAFNVDLMVGSDFLTAQSIVQVGLRQMAQVVEYFNRGRIAMVEFDVPPNSELAGQLVRDVDIYPGLRYAAVFDDEQMEVVSGDTRIPPGGRLLVIGKIEEVGEVGRQLTAADTEPIERVFILGGGEIAYQTAKLLEQRDLVPKVVERDRERGKFLAKNLPDSFVLNEDATDPDFLRSEGLERAQLVISAMRPDERNLLASLQAKHLGADRVVSVVHNQKYEALFDDFNVDVTVNPRNKVIQEILRHTRDRPLEKVAFVEKHRAEVIEVELDTDSVLVDRPLKDAARDLPEAIVIGAASRGERTVIPGGETELRAGDTLVIFAESKVVNELMDKI